MSHFKSKTGNTLSHHKTIGQTGVAHAAIPNDEELRTGRKKGSGAEYMEEGDLAW